MDDLFLFKDGWGAGSAPAGGGEVKSGAGPNHLGEGAGCTVRSSPAGGEGWTRGKVSGKFYQIYKTYFSIPAIWFFYGNFK